MRLVSHKYVSVCTFLLHTCKYALAVDPATCLQQVVFQPQLKNGLALCSLLAIYSEALQLLEPRDPELKEIIFLETNNGTTCEVIKDRIDVS
jgi:hypothetical protein